MTSIVTSRVKCNRSNYFADLESRDSVRRRNTAASRLASAWPSMGQRLSLPARLCSSSAMPSGSNTDSDRERESSEGGNTSVRSGLVRAHSSGPANAPQSFFNRSEPRPRAASLVFGRRSRKSGRNKERVESSSQTQEQSPQLQQQEPQEHQPGPSGIQSTSSGKKGKSRGQQNWASKLNCRKMKVGSGKTVTEASDIPQPSVTCEACVCTGYRRTAEHHLGAGVVFQAAPYRQELPEVDSLPPRDPDDIATEEAARAARQARRSSCPSSLGSQVRNNLQVENIL
ncbi:hypothetical protein B566_EDAN014253 [Ephemera danica]|nr:hypothetical protein B566_EDAN014253 [Ephemera danica]